MTQWIEGVGEKSLAIEEAVCGGNDPLELEWHGSSFSCFLDCIIEEALLA